MHVTDMKGFRDKCDNIVDSLIKCGAKTDENRRAAGLDYFFKAAEVDTQYITEVEIPNINELQPTISKLGTDCIGIVYRRFHLCD